MNIVTVDGIVMCEGANEDEWDFHLDKFGHPIFHEGTRIHQNSIVQFWKFDNRNPDEHRIYIAKRSTEGNIRLEMKACR